MTGIDFGITYGRVSKKILYKESKDTLIQKQRVSYKYSTLIFSELVDKTTGEMSYELKFTINPSKIYFKGKNYRNIPIEDFIKIIEEFCVSFNMDMSDVILTAPFEPSITISNPQDFIFSENTIKDRLILSKNRLFEATKNDRGGFLGYATKHDKNSQSYDKAYLPALKFDEPDLNSLRIERHFQKVQNFKRVTGIDSWADLISEDGILKCYNEVRKVLNDMVIYDPTLRQSKKYPEWLNKMISMGNNGNYLIGNFSKSASVKTVKSRYVEYKNLSHKKGEGLHDRLALGLDDTINKSPEIYTLVNGIKPEVHEGVNNNKLINLKKKDIEKREKMNRVINSLKEDGLINKIRIGNRQLINC